MTHLKRLFKSAKKGTQKAKTLVFSQFIDAKKGVQSNLHTIF